MRPSTSACSVAVARDSMPNPSSAVSSVVTDEATGISSVETTKFPWTSGGLPSGGPSTASRRRLPRTRRQPVAVRDAAGSQGHLEGDDVGALHCLADRDQLGDVRMLGGEFLEFVVQSARCGVGAKDLVAGRGVRRGGLGRWVLGHVRCHGCPTHQWRSGSHRELSRFPSQPLLPFVRADGPGRNQLRHVGEVRSGCGRWISCRRSRPGARSQHGEDGQRVDDVAGQLLVADDVVAQLAGVEPGADTAADGGGCGGDLGVDSVVARRPDRADGPQVDVPCGVADVGEAEADEPPGSVATAAASFSAQCRRRRGPSSAATPAEDPPCRRRWPGGCRRRGSTSRRPAPAPPSVWGHGHPTSRLARRDGLRRGT